MAARPDREPGLAVEGARGGVVYASDVRRGRLLSAAFAVVGELGYEGLTARRVAERAGVSNRTFYEVFSDREDCFLGAFNYAVDGLEREMHAGWDAELGWSARVRGGLTALLQVLDLEPAVRRLVFVEALSAGPRVLARRARVLEGLAGVIDEGRANGQAPAGLPGLTAEGVVGATFGVIHARLLELRPGSLVGLRNALMAGIVFPYRGSKAATRELELPAPRVPARRRDGDGLSRRPLSSASPTDYRLTVRTQMALAAVAGRPGLSNREVSEVIGLADQGQISRMMKRLQGQGLVENAHGAVKRQARAWRLTGDGEAVIDAHKPLKQAQRKAGKGGKLATTRSVSARRGKYEPITPAGTDTTGKEVRMTALTRQVLGAVAELSGPGAGPSNREIAGAVNVKDEGQISKLLRRLLAHGLLANTAGNTPGPNAWRLTPGGEQTMSSSREQVVTTASVQQGEWSDESSYPPGVHVHSSICPTAGDVRGAFAEDFERAKREIIYAPRRNGERER
jgi:AcrR family transcriptional regulator/DNA-binding MarR family transcriptional regulator